MQRLPIYEGGASGQNLPLVQTMKNNLARIGAKIKSFARKHGQLCLADADAAGERLSKWSEKAEASAQSPLPGSRESISNLPAFPLNSFASGKGSCFLVKFGQTFDSSALSLSQGPTPFLESGLIAAAGHSGSQTPQSMHSSG